MEPIAYDEARDTVRAVFDDIKSTRKVADVNNFWKYLANEPRMLGHVWASAKEIMTHRLKTEVGKALYKLRKQTVEPVFGIIKEVMGFRRFTLRGREKVSLEWTLVCVSYNLKRLFTLKNLAGAG